MIDMPSHIFFSNDLCFLNVWLCNASDVPLVDSPVFVILDAYGQYYFAPEWGANLSYFVRSIGPGGTLLSVLPEFSWPSGVGSASGLVFYAAITDPEFLHIIGDYDMWEFGWQE